MDGIININKPAGPTSFNIVSRVRHLSGTKKAGHAGTLDPAASGVLPVCLGKATRVIEFLMDTSKTYLAEVELGKATTTYDAEGEVTGGSDPGNISREQIEAALERFRGEIRQTPPMYSALKFQGKALYKYAREGIEVEREERQVTIHRIELTGWQSPTAAIEVECGKGTYIRSLAHDLGQALGCGAHLKSLVRSRCGQFDIADAVEMPALEEAFKQGEAERYIRPPDSALSGIRAVTVNDEAAVDIGHGRLAEMEPAEGDEEYLRAYTEAGEFLAILRFNRTDRHWQPYKVFQRPPTPSCEP